MKEVAKALLKIGAIIVRKDRSFTWASGIKSPIYIDNRILISFPPQRGIVEKELQKLINFKFPEANFIVGTATAGIPHAAYVSLMMNLPMAYVRSSSKDHGTKSLIEGSIPKNAKLVVIEDLITTGGSCKKVVEILKSEGYSVLGVAAIFSYQLKRNVMGEINFASLTNLDELLEVAIEENYILNKEAQDIKTFRDEL